MSRPLVIAHRGASAEAPENTLVAFRRALELGVDALELDVQTTSDGVPLVFHDRLLRRLTGARGRVPDKTSAALSGLRVGGEPIPTLEAVLALARQRAVVQIELKRGVAVPPVLRAIRREQAARGVILASFELDLIREAAGLAPQVPRMLITGGRLGVQHSLRRMAAAGAGGLSVDFRAVRDREWVRAVKARGAALWCWTVNTPADFRRLAEWGVDGILTDNPALLQRTI